MATADKNDHNNAALEKGETVTGSVTGLTDAPASSGGSSAPSTSTPSTSTPSTSAPSTSAPSTGPATTTTKKSTTTTTAPAKAEPDASATNVEVSPAYVRSMEVGYAGETPSPDAQRTTLYPAHGDGDLSVGANTAARPLAAKTDAPDATAEGGNLAPAEGTGLDPSNDQQWGNGPDTKD